MAIEVYRRTPCRAAPRRHPISRTSRTLAFCLGFFWIAGVLTSIPASAQSVADFYKGRMLTVYVSSGPGGGYDTYARTLARHIGKHIPGHPTTVVKNRPGAGGLILANELYNILPQDGSVIAIIANGVPLEPLFGSEQAKYDPRKFNWLGSTNNEVNVCMSWHTSPVKKWQDLQTTPMAVGGTGALSETDTFPRMLNDVLGTKLKLVTGYKSSTEIILAMERGEIDGICGQSLSTVKARRAEPVREGKLKILIQMATSKHPEFPDVPFIMDMVKNERDEKLLKLFFTRLDIGRPFVAPPGVPPDRVKALRVAFAATMKDPAFLADAEKQRLEIKSVSGERISELVDNIYKAPPDIVQRVREISGR